QHPWIRWKKRGYRWLQSTVDFYGWRQKLEDQQVSVLSFGTSESAADADTTGERAALRCRRFPKLCGQATGGLHQSWLLCCVVGGRRKKLADQKADRHFAP